jgi:hypothetical protein
MKSSEILYEPLPIGRLGIRKDTEEVVIAKDFSCFAHLLEEYISYGAVDIVMPKSAPEVSTFNEMPPLLRKRIRVVDDENEIETMRRLLFNLRKEFSVNISDDDHHLMFPKGTSPELVRSIDSAHTDVRKLALGFNNDIQIEIDPDKSIKNIRLLRERVSNGQARAVLANIEAMLRLYSDVGFNAPSPPVEIPPAELISVFDKLINDQSYLDYSESIHKLAVPESREQALIALREIERGVRGNHFVSTGWNYIAKVIKVWTGVLLPDSSDIARIANGRSLPPLVNLQDARINAVEIWKKSSLTESPLGRDGKPVTDDKIVWVPPLESMEVYTPTDKAVSFGKVGELIEVLKSVSSEMDRERTNRTSIIKG